MAPAPMRFPRAPVQAMEGSVEDSGHAWPRQHGGAAARWGAAHRNARGQEAAAAAAAPGAFAIPKMMMPPLAEAAPGS